MSVTIYLSGPGSTFCFEAEIIKRALRAEGVVVEVQTNHEYEMTEEQMEESRRRMVGDWGGGDEAAKQKYMHLGKVERKVLIVEDHQPWGG